MATQPESTASANAQAPGPRRGDFDSAYTSGAAPWDVGRPQPAFLELAEAGELKGIVLDAGCGTGEHAIMAAAAGHEVIGIDAAPAAIRLAREKAASRGVEVRFEVWDALELPALGIRCQTVLDCGLFHVFDDDSRRRYVESLASVIDAGGRYFMLCFSDKQPGDWGPRRITQAEIRAAFAGGWRVDSIEDARFEVTMERPVLAWLASITRT